MLMSLYITSLQRSTNIGMSERWAGQHLDTNIGMSELSDGHMRKLECCNHQVGLWENQYWMARIIRWAYGESNIGMLESTGGPMGKQYWNVGIIRWAYGEINMGTPESPGGPTGKQTPECRNVRMIR
jgi:hypothetical protein